MVVEKEVLPYLQWLLFSNQGYGALFAFLLLVSAASLVGILVCYAVTSARIGLWEAFYAVAQTIANAFPDFRRTSFGRVAALSRLAIQESIRRKVLVAFAIFAVILLYAGWFLDVRTDHPARLYLSFALTATNYLILVMALFLSTFSLPNDIKNRTMYTVATKPVRATEIVLGRIVGFSIVGTAMLALMGIVSYGFVVRNLSHNHTLDADPAEIEASLAKDGVWEGETSPDAKGLHRHPIRIDRRRLDEGGDITTELERGHWHVVRRTGEGAAARYAIGPPEGQLQARVPVYGKLSFLSRTGTAGDGVNVGSEWGYRKYIEGGTLASAVWTFENITPERFPDGLPLELNLSIFRTHKGNIEKTVLGTLFVKSPNRGAKIRSSTPRNFHAQEFVVDRQRIPRKLQAIDGETSTIKDIDLFDLVEDGKLEVWLQCAERGQYFGVAQADLYVRSANRPFWLNFIKGYAGIWLQMVLIVGFGVTASTFLSGPIAMLGTLGAVVLGLSATFVFGVFGGAIQANPILGPIVGTIISEEKAMPGGGPIESLVRLVTQKNIMIELDFPWLAELIIKSLDAAMLGSMLAVTRMLPDFAFFDTTKYLAYGFDIDNALLAQQATIVAGYMLVLTIVGYFFLKTRELAA
ncbi:MAG: ABC transporter permease [Planctomycetes bacterium]|nr:ABC transporter permease [Planctomycetota bacterium]